MNVDTPPPGASESAPPAVQPSTPESGNASNLSTTLRSSIPWRLLLRWGMVFALLYGLVAMLWQSGSALWPFIFGIVVAYLILPLVNYLDQFLPRWGAILLVYILGGFLIVLGFTFVVPPLVDQSRAAFSQIRLPSILELEAQADQIFDLYRQYIPQEFQGELEATLASLLTQLQNNLTNLAQQAGTFLLQRAQQVFNTLAFLFGFIIIPFWIFYVLNDQRLGIAALNRLIHPAARTDFWSVLTITDRVFSNYIRGQIILGLAVGTASFVGLTVLNFFGFEIQYTLLLAVIAGFTELIPIVGPILGAIPAVLVALLTDSPGAALAVLALYVAIQQLEAHLLVPRIIGDSVGLHPAILMVILVIAGQVGGLLGVILAAPITAVARDVFRYVYGRLGDPPLPAGSLPPGYEANVSRTVALPPSGVVAPSDAPETATVMPSQEA